MFLQKYKAAQLFSTLSTKSAY